MNCVNHLIIQSIFLSNHCHRSEARPELSYWGTARMCWKNKILGVGVGRGIQRHIAKKIGTLVIRRYSPAYQTALCKTIRPRYGSSLLWTPHRAIYSGLRCVNATAKFADLNRTWEIHDVTQSLNALKPMSVKKRNMRRVIIQDKRCTIM